MRLAVWLRSWLRTLLTRSRTESEMDTELRFHIESYAEDLARTGVMREEALRRARVEFGGLERTKEECRDARGITVAHSLLQDLHYGLRMLGKSPGLTAIVVITLVGLLAALGLTRTMSKLLMGVSPSDPFTYLAVVILLATVSLVACWIPARRATRVDPMIALRYE